MSILPYLTQSTDILHRGLFPIVFSERDLGLVATEELETNSDHTRDAVKADATRYFMSKLLAR